MAIRQLCRHVDLVGHRAEALAVNLFRYLRNVLLRVLPRFQLINQPVNRVCNHHHDHLDNQLLGPPGSQLGTLRVNHRLFPRGLLSGILQNSQLPSLLRNRHCSL